MKSHLWPLLPICLLLLVASACIQASSASLPKTAPQADAQGDRANCDEIKGTAFHSTNERTWYEQNCSQWPGMNIDQGSVAVVTAPPPAECAQIRGKPYESDAQRAWFLSNCTGAANVGSITSTASAAPQPGDRTDCNAIKGTPYRTDSERAWYLANCNPSTAPQSGPDRTNCDEIRGTPYRSDTERAWYLSHCQSTAPAVPANQAPQTAVQPKPADDKAKPTPKPKGR